MTDTGLYGIILCRTMCRIKAVTLCKRRRREISYYLSLWSFTLNLLQDEMANDTDNTALLREYIKAYKFRFYPLDLESDTDGGDCIRKPPVQAVSAMARLVAQLEIDMADIGGNSEKIWRELHALHNLPRCLLPLNDPWYKREKDVMEFAAVYDYK